MAFIFTDAELEYDEMYNSKPLCRKCGACVSACPGKAIAQDGTVDPWQCAVYYNSTKNPFMSPDAFAGMEDRLAIIAGETQVTPETAKAILNKIYFYPPCPARLSVLHQRPQLRYGMLHPSGRKRCADQKR